MTEVYVAVANPNSNNIGDLWSVGGISYLKWGRASYSTPASLDFYCAVDPTYDIESPFQPTRFNPFQNVVFGILAYLDGTPYAIPLFVGRIDAAEQIDDPYAADDRGHRQWHVLARDWLAVLSDNYVQPGLWATAGDPNRGIPLPPTAVWDGNYVGDYANRHGAGSPPLAGEFRANIVYDLVMNGIPDLLHGFFGWWVEPPPRVRLPNSKPIERNLQTLSQTSMLDAIRDIARADPWQLGNSGVDVDGYDLAVAGFPASAGIGAELQIVQWNTPINGAAIGRAVEYYMHGAIDSGFFYVYPQESSSPVALAPIVSYDFSRQGLDLFTRVRTSGQGVDSTLNRPVAASQGGGTGSVILAQEAGPWDPSHGNFGPIRREYPSYSNSIVGDWMYEEQRQDETQAIKTRDLRDTAFAETVNSQFQLASYPGGLNQGTVTVLGPPLDGNGTFGLPTHVLRPGELIHVVIENLGLDFIQNQDPNQIDKTQFIASSYIYEWPDDHTIINVSRIPFASLSKQLVDIQRRVNESLTAHGKAWVSQWRHVDPSGSMIFIHNLGTKPSKVVVDVGYWDGRSYAVNDPSNGPIPKPGTIVNPPAMTWDASQGQNLGHMFAGVNDRTVTLLTAYWITWSDGQSQWLTRTDPNVLVRLRVYP